MCPRCNRNQQLVHLQNCPEITVRDRVEIASHYDLWIRGARYGTVISIFAGNAKVRMDKLATYLPLAKFPVDDLRRIN